MSNFHSNNMIQRSASPLLHPPPLPAESKRTIVDSENNEKKTKTLFGLISLKATIFSIFISQAIAAESPSKDMQFCESGKILSEDNGNTTMTATTTKQNTMAIIPTATIIDKSGVLWRFIIVGLCAVWASNFAVAKIVMAEPGVDSSLYAMSRFGIAALALMPGAVAAVKKGGVIGFKTAREAAICGCWVAFGYLGQTIGLLTTTASRSCVICTLHCVFVAIISEVTRVSRWRRRSNDKLSDKNTVPFDFIRLVPAIVAVMGVAIVELKGAGGSPTIGDLISFAQPIGFGMGYIQLEGLMRERPDAALPVSAIKLAIVAFFSFAMFCLTQLLVGHNTQGYHVTTLVGFIPQIFEPILSSPTALGGILYTGIITTAVALWVESIAFKRVPAKDASIILTTEPLFAAVASALALGETFCTADYVGAILIVSACVLSSILDNTLSDHHDKQCCVNNNDEILDYSEEERKELF